MVLAILSVFIFSLPLLCCFFSIFPSKWLNFSWKWSKNSREISFLWMLLVLLRFRFVRFLLCRDECVVTQTVKINWCCSIVRWIRFENRNIVMKISAKKWIFGSFNIIRTELCDFQMLTALWNYFPMFKHIQTFSRNRPRYDTWIFRATYISTAMNGVRDDVYAWIFVAGTCCMCDVAGNTFEFIESIFFSSLFTFVMTFSFVFCCGIVFFYSIFVICHSTAYSNKRKQKRKKNPIRWKNIDRMLCTLRAIVVIFILF